MISSHQSERSALLLLPVCSLVEATVGNIQIRQFLTIGSRGVVLGKVFFGKPEANRDPLL
jgi:hypothetical protein